jgi:hypothetical protein
LIWDRYSEDPCAGNFDRTLRCGGCCGSLLDSGVMFSCAMFVDAKDIAKFEFYCLPKISNLICLRRCF